MFTKTTSLVIPTRNRYDLLSKVIKQLYDLKIRFNEIIIIDSSDKQQRTLIKSLKKKYNIKLFFSKPSSSLQRNIGIKKSKARNKLIMFLDDDVIFLKNAFKKMNNLINKNKNNNEIVGFCFNQVENTKFSLFDQFKKNSLFKKMSLYSDLPGKLTRSGWHTKILNVRKDTKADWVFTTASIYKKKMIKNKFFTTSFGKYSYLEDLEFSLNVTRLNKYFLISSQAKFKHPLNIDRSNFLFGKIEILNRYKIIKKYKLNKYLFFLNCFFRFLLSLTKILLLNFNSFMRALGNIKGLMLIMIKNN